MTLSIHNLTALPNYPEFNTIRENIDRICDVRLDADGGFEGAMDGLNLTFINSLACLYIAFKAPFHAISRGCRERNTAVFKQEGKVFLLALKIATFVPIIYMLGLISKDTFITPMRPGRRHVASLPGLLGGAMTPSRGSPSPNAAATAAEPVQSRSQYAQYQTGENTSNRELIEARAEITRLRQRNSALIAQRAPVADLIGDGASAAASPNMGNFTSGSVTLAFGEAQQDSEAASQLVILNIQNEDLIAEVARLRQVNAELRAEVAPPQAPAAVGNEDVASLVARNTELQALVESLMDAVGGGGGAPPVEANPIAADRAINASIDAEFIQGQIADLTRERRVAAQAVETANARVQDVEAASSAMIAEMRAQMEEALAREAEVRAMPLFVLAEANRGRIDGIVRATGRTETQITVPLNITAYRAALIAEAEAALEEAEDGEEVAAAE